MGDEWDSVNELVKKYKDSRARLEKTNQDLTRAMTDFINRSTTAVLERELERRRRLNDNGDNDNGNDVDNISDAGVDEDEPPKKKGRGQPAGKAAKGKAASKKPAPKGRAAASSSGRKSAPKKEESEDEEEYEVEKILDMRKRKGGREFYIKWKGYSKAKSTWEPEAHLSCADLVKEFEQKEKERKDQPVRSLRPERKETDRYVDTADLKHEGSKRHSNRLGKSPRKTYREAEDD